MRCKKARIQISALVDGELNRSEEVALERHVAACVECARQKAELSMVHDSMSLWEDEEPSAWLAESFGYKLRELAEEGGLAGAPSGKRTRWVFGAAAAGFAVALLMIGLLIQNRFQPPVPQPSEKPQAVTAPSAPERAPAPMIAAKPAPSPAPREVRPAARPAGRPARVRTAVRPRGHDEHWYATESAPAAGSDHVAGRAAPASAPLGMAESPDAAIVEKAVAGKVTDNLGEAGLAMNETIERVRGNLQNAVDLIISQAPVPVDHSNGGNTP